MRSNTFSLDILLVEGCRDQSCEDRRPDGHRVHRRGSRAVRGRLARGGERRRPGGRPEPADQHRRPAGGRKIAANLATDLQ